MSVNAANTKYTDVDGVLFNKDQTKLVCYPAGKTAPGYTIPSPVTCIDSVAFYSSKLDSVVIPASVNNIGNNAFSGSSKLSSISAYPVTPVNVDWNTFCGVDTAHCVLHVPAASLAAYKSAYVWKDFKIQGDLVTGLTPISADVKITVANGLLLLSGIPAGEPLSVYNTVGTSIYHAATTGSTLGINLPAHGVYIVQLGRSSRKVIY